MLNEVVILLSHPKIRKSRGPHIPARYRYLNLPLGQPYRLFNTDLQGRVEIFHVDTGFCWLSSWHIKTSFHKFGIGDYVHIVGDRGITSTKPRKIQFYDHDKKAYSVGGVFYPANRLVYSHSKKNRCGYG